MPLGKKNLLIVSIRFYQKAKRLRGRYNDYHDYIRQAVANSIWGLVCQPGSSIVDAHMFSFLSEDSGLLRRDFSYSMLNVGMRDRCNSGADEKRR